MGFCPEETIYRLTFEGSNLDGLEVRMAALSVGEYAGMLRLLNASLDEAAEANDEITKVFASSLRSWNLEDKSGNPVPTTLEGVNSQEHPFILSIFTAWQKAMANVDEDLGKDSPSGETLLEASLGMAGQSNVLPSGLKAS